MRDDYNTTIFLNTSLLHFFVNPFTPKSDQFVISPVASPEILHHTVWSTWLFIAYSGDKWLCNQFSLCITYIHFSLKVGRMYILSLGVERFIPVSAHENHSASVQLLAPTMDTEIKRCGRFGVLWNVRLATSVVLCLRITRCKDITL